MAFKIDDFRSEVSKGGGFAMGSLYKVTLPTIAERQAPFNLLCRATNIPGRQILSTEKTIGIHTTKNAYGYASEDVSMTFYCLNDFEVRNYFEEWQALAADHVSGQVGYFKDYVRNVQIAHLKKEIAFPIIKREIFDSGKIPAPIRNRLPTIGLGPLGGINLAQGEVELNLLLGGAETYKCELQDAYPTTLNAIELTADGQVLEINVQLSYKKWISSEQNKPGLFEEIATPLVGDFLQSDKVQKVLKRL